MAQSQMQQQAMPAQAANPQSGAPNAFPHAYGAYPGMNAGSTPAAYYAGGGGGAAAPQQQPGQQNPAFAGGYQNYPYSQPNSDN